MVGPARPQFVLFGSSIVQLGFYENGWGADLAHFCARKADIFMRGYSGWNSRQALQVVKQVFPKDDLVKPSPVIVYFGGNDSVLPHPDGLSSHVPLDEYVKNMRQIAIHLRDGIHFKPIASAIVANEIRLAIFQAEWTPSLISRLLPVP